MIAGYLIEYGKPKLFAFHWSPTKFVGVILQPYKACNATILLTFPFGSSTYPSTQTPKTYNQLLTNHIHFVLVAKINICAFDDKNV
jgi:hypothetical protein